MLFIKKFNFKKLFQLYLCLQQNHVGKTNKPHIFKYHT